MGKQRKTTKAQAAGHLTPPPKIVSRKCSGIEDLARLDRTREVFEADAERWKAGKWTKADLKAVFGYWIGYPSLLEKVGHDWRADPTRIAAYHALNSAHYQATHVLMIEAGKHGLDPHPLQECARVVQEIYAREPWKYYAGRYDIWPDCMGDARYTLPTGQQDAIRAGEAVFVRLAVALEIADAPDMDAVQKAITDKPETHSAVPIGTEEQHPRAHGAQGPDAPSTSRPMPLTEIADRVLKDPKKTRKLKSVYGDRLVKVGDKSWTILLDGLPANIQKELDRA